MYERIILDNKTEGSTSLPSVIKINKDTAFVNHKTTYFGNNRIINNGVIEAGHSKVLDGTIGNNKLEFNFEFYLDDLTDNIKELKNLLKNDSNISINRSTLEEKTKYRIIEISDYSYQSMTIKNYDFIAKVFVYDDITTNQYSAKIVSAKAIAILKSYTLKKAWIIIDASAITMSSPKYKIIIDFTYKFFMDENTEYLKYRNNNSNVNVSSILVEPSHRSPYYDDIKLMTSSNESNSLLSSQSNYFTLSLNDLFGLSNTDHMRITRDIRYNTVASNELLNKSQLYDTYKIKRYASKNKIDFSLSREYYSFSMLGNSLLGTRVISMAVPVSNIEEYPICTDYIHYMFKYSVDMSDTETQRITDLTEATLRKALKANHIYMWDHPFTYNITFISTVNNVQSYCIDIYIMYNIFDSYTYTIPNGTKTITIEKIINTNSSEHKSVFDPTFIYEINDDVTRGYTPYIYADPNLQSAGLFEGTNTTDNNVARVVSTIDDFRVLKNNDVYDQYFNIQLDNTDNSESNILNSDNITNAFKTAGFRIVNNSVSEGISKTIDYIDKNNEILENNLFEYLKNVTASSLFFTKNKTLQMDNDECLFVFLGISNIKEIKVTYKYSTGLQYTKIKNTIGTDALYGEANLFIIPNEPNLSTITFDSSYNSIKIY